MNYLTITLFLIILLRILFCGTERGSLHKAFKRSLWIAGIYAGIAGIEYFYYGIRITDLQGMTIPLKHILLFIACTIIFTIEELPDGNKSPE